MTDKAYIVVNEQQEQEVLEKLEQDGFKWLGGAKPTDNKPSNLIKITILPYIIFVGDVITWSLLTALDDEEVVFDGRKDRRKTTQY